MKCKEHEERIVDYLAGELSAAERERMEAHIKICGECTKALEEYRNVLSAAKEIEIPVPSEDYWTAGLEEVKNYRPSGRFILKPVILIAGLVLAVSFFASRISNDGREKTAGVKNNYTLVLHRLPYTEDALLDNIEYVDDASAGEVLNVLFENGNVPYTSVSYIYE
ncbi:MAG: zf-HC2 domain-containing protein [Candidatus Omnitrophica bacterium]|nr:zf-HC2 domain-containing protein [Candidatus Omnitrophota bacterium]